MSWTLIERCVTYVTSSSLVGCNVAVPPNAVTHLPHQSSHHTGNQSHLVHGTFNNNNILMGLEFCQQGS